MKILTTLQMKMAEAAANMNDTSYLRLMENAGAACAKAIREEYGVTVETPKRITVVCGRGNNGGDGYVIARKFSEIGCPVTIIMAGGSPITELSKEMLSRVEQLPINIITFDLNKASALDALQKCDIIVEAVFGVGLAREVTGVYAELFGYINSCEAQVVCIDVPGGVNTDTGEIMGASIDADFTIAVCAAKPCHILLPASKKCGKVKVVNIGITEEEQNVSGDPYCYSIDEDMIKKLLPSRNPVSNKGDYGHVLSVCGSRNMPGAAVLAAMGAVRSGAGLVTAAFPDCAYSAIGSKITSPLLLPLNTNEKGTFSASATDELKKAMSKSTAILVGCGLGVNRDTAQILYEILVNAKVPVVIDADGINILSHNINVLKAAKVPIIITPHPGEMSRLTGLSVEQIQSDRIQTAVDFAEKNNVTVVLKGANTVIAMPGKKSTYVNVTGNAGMAKGGSGDLLAGLMCGFLASGIKPEDAAVLAVYLHGLAGDIAAEKYSVTAMTPTDTANCLPFALSIFE
ncbi:MAG: NAD(P)H-hydrate dehydratase [Ruminococcaceae bacterium]|nr:NAD(P)H-hydrate dehydratase [Oscillospiraceae bacterium]